MAFIRKLCPLAFDAFEFLPSIGTSGGIIKFWKSSLLDGHLAFTNNFVVSVEFKSKHNDAEWMLTMCMVPVLGMVRLNLQIG